MSEPTEETNSAPTEGKVHNHAEEVQNSRPQSNPIPRSNSNLGPIRSRAGTPSRTVTPEISSGQNLPQDIPRVSHLLPSTLDDSVESPYADENLIHSFLWKFNQKLANGSLDRHKRNSECFCELSSLFRTSFSWMN